MDKDIVKLPLHKEKFSELEVAEQFKEMKAGQTYFNKSNNRMIKIFGFNRTENNDIRVFFQHYLKRTNKLSGKAPILSSLKLDDFLSKFQC